MPGARTPAVRAPVRRRRARCAAVRERRERLAACYQERWEAETGFAQLKIHLRGPGRVLRSRTPDLVRQEIWACLLTHWALATLICTAATAAGVDPDRIKFPATLRIVRRSVTDRVAFPP
ncbi:transposase [Planomonospora sp. ID82291]|uniref:transposase n=1 Tax=Planomonospora sp. ID82291 TaxID=2738136 RepID=UPI0018C3584E|nr:transposase [Planomonospora sp. ID82291]